MAAAAPSPPPQALPTTRIVAVDPSKIGIDIEQAVAHASPLLGRWRLQFAASSSEHDDLERAAQRLRTSDVPVAFPTETVYGLGADATRSGAVRGIYRAKGRPSDNPLIVHFHSLEQLRRLLGSPAGLADVDVPDDPIPRIYAPLIRRFWPGPLTMLMPRNDDSPLAPEVTAGLSTFGARMPNSVVALALLRMADVPVAAPSANASTKPSPTAAEHVKHDLDGRIELIVDGGPCEVGVESTVVDGLSDPPLILRPGGITIEELRQVPGWERVELGYKDAAMTEDKPKAPGMKYRHYSPSAEVTLYEAGSDPPEHDMLVKLIKQGLKLGFVRTSDWSEACGLPNLQYSDTFTNGNHVPSPEGRSVMFGTVAKPKSLKLADEGTLEILDVSLGKSAKAVARGLFSALRELDLKNVDHVFVEGIDDAGGDVAAAVMNRLRKAARNVVKP